MAFIVAHFLTTDEIEILSKDWLTGKNSCKWPPVTSTAELKKLILEHEAPKENWTTYDIVVMGKYDSYLLAKKKAELALDTSNLETENSGDEEKKSRRKKQKRKAEKEILFSDEESKAAKVTNAALPEPPEVLMDEENGMINDCQVSDTLSTEYVSYTVIPSAEVGSNVNVNFNSLEGAISKAQPTETEKHILKMLEDIKTTQREMLLLFHRLLPVQEASAATNPSSMPSLPLKSDEDMQEFEEFLNDPVNFSSCVKYFICRISADAGVSTRRMLSEILTDDLAEKYNWAGRHPKKAFKSLKCLSLILCTLKENLCTRETPVKMIEDAIKDWLKHASFRKNYKLKKIA